MRPAEEASQYFTAIPAKAGMAVRQYEV